MTQQQLLRTTLAYIEGKTANLDGIRRNHNPYLEHSDGRQIEPSAWALGWDEQALESVDEGINRG